jgi:hypothetical protein
MVLTKPWNAAATSGEIEDRAGEKGLDFRFFFSRWCAGGTHRRPEKRFAYRPVIFPKAVERNRLPPEGETLVT